MFNLAVWIFIATQAMPAFAKDNSWCENDLQPSAAIHKPLTKSQAEEIIGTAAFGDASPLIRNALKYVLSQNSASFEEKIEDMQTLFIAIRERLATLWRADRFLGPEGSIGFGGEEGHFVVLYPNGRLFKGRLHAESDINPWRLWNGRATQLKEIKINSDGL